MDTSISHPSTPTLVVGEMHKETQQTAGGPTSLGDTSEDRAHPQLSSGSNPSVLVDKTKSAGDRLKTAHTTSGANEESRANDISRKVKLEDLSYILKDTRSAFSTPDSPTDEPIIVLDVSEEEKNAKNDKDTIDTSVPPPSLKSAQIQELMAQPELSKLLALHDFASCLPTELKELPSKITGLSREIKELKQHIKDMEIELPGDLIEIPTKLESFTSTISSLSSQVSDTLNRFSTVMENASGAASMNVPSAGQAPPSPAEGEKNTKDAKWREVLQACPDKSEKGWKTIYDLVKTRVDQLTQTEQELKIYLNQPLKEQDPLDELTDLANKKRKRTSDLRDHSRSTKKHKSSSSA
ncbi:hypothetical protein Tco_0762739 [Tanacetum coccineum]